MSDDLVNVLVPRRHLPKVYGYIAELEREGPVTISLPPKHEPVADADPAAAAEQMFEEWTPKRIRRMVDESPDAMLNILKALAERSGEWLSTKALAEAIGPEANWNTVAGTLGAFGRRCSNRYGLETPPFETHWDYAASCKMNRMPKEIADEVLRCMRNGAA